MSSQYKDPRSILLSRSVRFTPDEIALMTDAQAWGLLYEEFPPSNKRRDTRPSICFTGFTALEKAKLEAVADEKGLRTVSGVSQSLKYLCTGTNAGPMKIEAAKQNGAIILSEFEFHALKP